MAGAGHVRSVFGSVWVSCAGRRGMVGALFSLMC